MGILESGSIYLHPMCWHPQEPGSTHIQSEISQPGPMDLRPNPGTVFLLIYFGSGIQHDNLSIDVLPLAVSLEIV